jgi:hypothetical protein
MRCVWLASSRAAAACLALCACSYVKIVHSDGTEESRFTPIVVNAPQVASEIPGSVRSTSVEIATVAGCTKKTWSI